MKPASNQLSNISVKLEVLLDLGSYSNSFSYIDSNNLGVDVGDIVAVRLKGRLLNGLVIAQNTYSNINKSHNKIAKAETLKYLPVESIVQKKIIQDWWRDWLESLALFYQVSNLKMFKTAFPPGWIGKHKKISQGLKNQIWIEIHRDVDFCKDDFTNREFSLINVLRDKGNWQSELIRSGFNFTLINSMVSKNLLIKTKRKKIINTKLNSFKNDLNEIKKPDLTNEQERAYQEMQEMQPGDVLLLWGETGSGKTEVYMRIAEDQL